KIPPEPVSRDPVARHQSGDHQRRIGGEGRRDHGSSRKPPGHVASGKEKLADAFSGARFIVEADRQVEEKIRGYHRTVNICKFHRPDPSMEFSTALLKKLWIIMSGAIKSRVLQHFCNRLHTFSAPAHQGFVSLYHRAGYAQLTPGFCACANCG